MSLLLASAAFAAAVVPACSWNEPGRHPYRGTPAEAVSRYIDIPAPTRARLVEKMQRGQADDNVMITRDDILGQQTYAPTITAMHFGRQTVCESVTRERWPAAARQPAKVYCADGECVIVPKICGNVSRVRTIAAGGGSGAVGTAAPASMRPAAAAAPEVDVEATDAMAQLVSPAPAPAPPPMPGDVFGGSRSGGRGLYDWTAPMPSGPQLTPGPSVGSPISPVPEPAGWLMFVLGAGTLILYSRYR